MVDEIAPDLMSNCNQEASRSIEVEYGGIPQRWLIIYSPQARKRSEKTLARSCSNQGIQEMKTFQKLCRKEFACEADAQLAYNALEKKLKMTMINDMHIVAKAKFKTKGRPSKDKKPDYYIYQVTGNVASSMQEYQNRLRHKSCFILATNQLDKEELDDDELQKAYKNQQKVERGFRFIKDPLFMASTLFLKSPKRIMALMMVMTLCLLVYGALEYRIRMALQKSTVTFPNQKGKLIKKPTARWVFQYFRGIHVLIEDKTKQTILNLNLHHISLLSLLGNAYVKLYPQNE
ncbi:MAG: IS1634 family transposase [Mariprofundales bacterium]